MRVNAFLYMLLCLQFLAPKEIVGQVFYSRTGHVHVMSQNNIKTIEADNYQVNSVIDVSSGEVKFEGLLKSFEFRLGALDRVFSSEKINVNQYPKIVFEGTIKGLENLDLSSFEEYEVEVEGNLYIWDEKRITSAKGKVTSIGNGEILVYSAFTMRIEEVSMHKLNDLIDQKLPDALNLTAESFGVNRDIYIDLDVNYKRKTW